MWEENNIAPHVVFEILSPGNTPKEMAKKLAFYEKYGVREYYLYDPDRITLKGWVRSDETLIPVEDMRGWTSPLLKIRFELGEDDLSVFGPDGSKFLSPLELRRLLQSEQKELEAERLRSKMLAAKLRELGIEI